MGEREDEINTFERPGCQLVIGIDPGYSSGAICVLDIVNGDTEFFDIEGELNTLTEFIRVLIARKSFIKLAIVEKVSVRPLQGSSSNFTFGEGVGRLHMALSCIGVPFETVTPQKWQSVIDTIPARAKIPKDVDEKTANKIRSKNKDIVKDAVHDFCSRRYPNAAISRPKRGGGIMKLFDRADALGIAHYAALERVSNIQTSQS